jgi:hypothetical protein
MIMEIRSLRPDELEDWTIHCEQVFGDVNRDYFRRHFENDPWRDFGASLWRWMATLSRLLYACSAVRYGWAAI